MDPILGRPQRDPGLSAGLSRTSLGRVSLVFHRNNKLFREFVESSRGIDSSQVRASLRTRPQARCQRPSRALQRGPAIAEWIELGRNLNLQEIHYRLCCGKSKRNTSEESKGESSCCWPEPHLVPRMFRRRKFCHIGLTKLAFSISKLLLNL